MTWHVVCYRRGQAAQHGQHHRQRSSEPFGRRVAGKMPPSPSLATLLPFLLPLLLLLLLPLLLLLLPLLLLRLLPLLLPLLLFLVFFSHLSSRELQLCSASESQQTSTSSTSRPPTWTPSRSNCSNSPFPPSLLLRPPSSFLSSLLPFLLISSSPLPSSPHIIPAPPLRARHQALHHALQEVRFHR
eukprot:219239-Hanusia_phi.AAC.4